MGLTPYLESNALLAQQANDTAEVDRCLNQMLPNELMELAAAAETLADKCRAVAADKRNHAARWHE